MKVTKELINKLKYDEDKADEEYEICVVCHALTQVKKSVPVEEREHYIPGIGQLCPICFNKQS